MQYSQNGFDYYSGRIFCLEILNGGHLPILIFPLKCYMVLTEGLVVHTSIYSLPHSL